MNIAIFGGSFDPPHLGHESIAYKALENLHIDKLVIVPTFLSPFKTVSHFTPEERLDLLKDLFNDENIIISDYEIIQNRATSTFETVKYIRSIYDIDELYLIIGADNLEKLHLWHNFEKLQHLVTFVVISRNDAKLNNGTIQFINISLDIDISSTSIRKELNIDFIPRKIQNKVRELWKIE